MSEGWEEKMPEWKTIRVKQELVAAAKSTIGKDRYRSLSAFVSEAIRLRLDELKESRKKIPRKTAEYPVIFERLLYTPHHTWAMVTPEGNVRVGLSDYARNRLRGIVDLQTEQVGFEVKKEEPFGVIETWMFMFDLYSPVSGKIVRINKGPQDEPLIINEDPYEAGWVAEIRPNNLIALEEELRGLMRLHQYEKWVSKLSQPRILGI